MVSTPELIDKPNEVYLSISRLKSDLIVPARSHTTTMLRNIFEKSCFPVCCILTSLTLTTSTTNADSVLPIADVHVHYSHDSVELTPPERVIEIMREAGLEFALVSSSDDNGTQLLSELAPDLIIPGLRPYRRRGELGSWFTDPAALAYVESLLEKNKYASIGEFHLYGEDADLEIPRRIVQLADEHNLILHAHSDADAIDRLFAQNENVKIIWAHSGFDSPEQIATMLEKHDRLWADLAFRSEVGSGGSLSDDWVALFKQFPDRMMLGTDTYTPERIYFIGSHADASRSWLSSLPDDVAQQVAWKNAVDLLIPVWEKNRVNKSSSTGIENTCQGKTMEENNSIGTAVIKTDQMSVTLQPMSTPSVSKPFSVLMTLCGEYDENLSLALDASMPTHGHGTNYQPEHTIVEKGENGIQYQVDGIVLHMPGDWQWQIEFKDGSKDTELTHDFTINQ